jgi:inosine/guanosine/xanthosine phosphorylase family protein
MAASGERARVRKVATTLKRRCGGAPDVAVILGSGWSPPTLEGEKSLSLSRVADLPRPGVSGHAGRLLTGTRGGLRVAVFCGRTHLYEGRTHDEVVRPVRAAAVAGAGVVILTNAAGGISPKLTPGRLMVIEDHLDLGMADPCTGSPEEAFGPRFAAMADAWDGPLRRYARSAARRHGLPCSSGVYAFVRGPAYETAAQAAMIGQWGGDAVGMSTVPEVMAARRMDMRALGLSVITNRAGRADDAHDAVLKRVAQLSLRVSRVLDDVLDRLGRETA